MASNLTETITELENQTWQALQKSGEEFLPFLTQDCIMLFPLGMKVSNLTTPNLKQVMTSEAFEPWGKYTMKDVEVTAVGSDGAIISYRSEASRVNNDLVFRALISSTWRKDTSETDGKWLLCFQQQTPYEDDLKF